MQYRTSDIYFNANWKFDAGILEGGQINRLPSAKCAFEWWKQTVAIVVRYLETSTVKIFICRSRKGSIDVSLVIYCEKVIDVTEILSSMPSSPAIAIRYDYEVQERDTTKPYSHNCLDLHMRDFVEIPCDFNGLRVGNCMLQSHFRLLDPSDIVQLQKNPISVMGRILKPSFVSIPLRRSNLSGIFPAQLNDRLVKTTTERQREENDETQRQMQQKENARNAGAGGDRDSPGICLDITQFGAQVVDTAELDLLMNVQLPLLGKGPIKVYDKAHGLDLKVSWTSHAKEYEALVAAVATTNSAAVAKASSKQNKAKAILPAKRW